MITDHFKEGEQIKIDDELLQNISMTDIPVMQSLKSGHFEESFRAPVDNPYLGCSEET